MKSSISSDSKTDAEARQRLIGNFNLDEIQANAILDMRLRRLTGLEYDKLAGELKELEERIAYYQRVLQDEEPVKQIIKEC